MSDYGDLSLWKRANELSEEVKRMTGKIAPYESILRLLRDKAAALPETIAGSASSMTPEARAHALRCAYELAQDVEYLAFFSLLSGRFRYRETHSLVARIHRLKRHLLAAVNNPGRESQVTP
jgi:hypothetical protein